MWIKKAWIKKSEYYLSNYYVDIKALHYLTGSTNLFVRAVLYLRLSTTTISSSIDTFFWSIISSVSSLSSIKTSISLILGNINSFLITKTQLINCTSHCIIIYTFYFLYNILTLILFLIYHFHTIIINSFINSKPQLLIIFFILC